MLRPTPDFGKESEVTHECIASRNGRAAACCGRLARGRAQRSAPAGPGRSRRNHRRILRFIVLHRAAHPFQPRHRRRLEREDLTALAPYKPAFVAGTAGLLGYGFYLVHWRPKRACADGPACARPIPNRFVQLALWTATVLVVAAFAFDYVALVLLGA